MVMIVNSKRRLERCLIWNLRGLPFRLPAQLSTSYAAGCFVCQPHCVWGWSRGVAAQSGATATLATTTRYMITDHRHAPSKHSTTAAQIRVLQSWLPVCLSTFDIAGCRTLNVPADAAFTKPHRV